jgi:hypothetical protein
MLYNNENDGKAITNKIIAGNNVQIISNNAACTILIEISSTFCFEKFFKQKKSSKKTKIQIKVKKNIKSL